jgi:hypothetical protein
MPKKINVSIGDRYGRVVLIEELNKAKKEPRGYARVFLCKCDCGNTKEISFNSLRTGNTRSCGCLKREVNSIHMSRITNSGKNKAIVKKGDKYNRLTVIKELDEVITKHGNNRVFLFQCECGNTHKADIKCVKSGNTKSCGCLITDGSKRMRGYKYNHPAEYRAYFAAKSRCTNKTRKDFKHYGGRGIEFRFKSIEEFFNEVGKKPTPKHTLDRINTDGHYEVGNVRWATQDIQVLNQRRNRLLTFNGQTLTLKEWSDKTGIKRQAIHARIDRRGWSVEKALTTPVR